MKIPLPPEPPKDREIPNGLFSKNEGTFIFIGLMIGLIGTLSIIVLSKLGIV